MFLLRSCLSHKGTKKGSLNWQVEAYITRQNTRALHVPRTWNDPLVRPKQWKRDVRFETWNVRSLYREGSLTTVVRELARCKLDLAGVEEVRWGKGGNARAGGYMFFYGKGNGNHQLNWGGRNEVIETSGRLDPLWSQNKRLHTPRTTDRLHTRILDKIDEYRRNRLLHLQRIPLNWIPLKSYHYRPQERRTIGRPKKR